MRIKGIPQSQHQIKTKEKVEAETEKLKVVKDHIVWLWKRFESRLGVDRPWIRPGEQFVQSEVANYILVADLSDYAAPSRSCFCDAHKEN